MKSYLDYFSDQKSGIIIFLRVYKVAHAIDIKYLQKGIKGSSQILKLYDQNEEEISLPVEITCPVVADNKYNYIRDEIIHLLKTENAFIFLYDRSPDGLKSLKQRIEAENLVHGTKQRWELRKMQWIETGFDINSNFDMAQLDYESIYKEVLEIEPEMESVIEYIRQIQPARLGEYEYLLKTIHEPDKYDSSSLRLFDMCIRSAVKTALNFHKKNGLEYIDAFQWACIGIKMAINKYNDEVVNVFPSYAAMWMRQVLNRYMPMYQHIFYVPVHFREKIDQMIAAAS